MEFAGQARSQYNLSRDEKTASPLYARHASAPSLLGGSERVLPAGAIRVRNSLLWRCARGSGRCKQQWRKKYIHHGKGRPQRAFLSRLLYVSNRGFTYRHIPFFLQLSPSIY